MGNLEDLIRNTDLRSADHSVSAFEDTVRRELAIEYTARHRAFNALMEHFVEKPGVTKLSVYESYYVLARAAIENGECSKEDNESDLAAALGFKY